MTVPAAEQAVEVHQSVVTDGPASGYRAIDVRVMGGIDVRVLPDRGCDIGAAWSRGVPLAWISAVGEHAPLGRLDGDAWIGAFGGGLVTTCGRRNVGPASEGHGLHGAASHVRATVTRVGRTDDGSAVAIEATMREAGALGPCLETRRTIIVSIERPRVWVRDVTRNLGRRPEPSPVLYHVNLGAPLWAPGATLDVAGHREALPRDADAEGAAWDRAPEPDERPERVFEHRLAPGGLGCARVAQPALGLAVEVCWGRAGLPRLHQWLHTAEGAYVLGIEPANCSLGGRAADRAAGDLPVLEPGAARETWVEIRAAWSAQSAAGGSTSNWTSRA